MATGGLFLEGLGHAREAELVKEVKGGVSKHLRSLGTNNISTAPSVFSRPGQTETRERPRQKRRFFGRPSPMPIGTPSNAMAASMPLLRRSTNRSRKGHPPTAQE